MTVARWQNTATENPMLRHVVLLGFKSESTPEQVKEVEDAFRALPSKISEIADFEWGANVSPEKPGARLYALLLPHLQQRRRPRCLSAASAHKEFGTVLRPHLERVLVVDYETNR
jgi:hypothetical protein